MAREIPRTGVRANIKRISWDEAADIIASEIKRVHKQYGPWPFWPRPMDMANAKIVHAAHGQPALLLDKMGGFTQQVRNPDSWEGWYWGAKHVWGEGIDRYDERLQLILLRILPRTCRDGSFLGMRSGDYSLGIQRSDRPAGSAISGRKSASSRSISVPDLNYGAAVHADKWIPILPNTDAALQLAIIYIWINEGTYDKEYVKTHTVGFDKVADYVLGKEDGIPKTPEWASQKCGVPEWTIKALARDWAAKATSIAHYFGGSYIRGPYSHEPARLECILLGMQGLGKPGVHQAQIALFRHAQAGCSAESDLTGNLKPPI